MLYDSLVMQYGGGVSSIAFQAFNTRIGAWGKAQLLSAEVRTITKINQILDGWDIIVTAANESEDDDGDSADHVIFTQKDNVILCISQHPNFLRVTFAAQDHDVNLAKIWSDMKERCEPVAPLEEGTVPIRFWQWTGQSPSNFTRELSCPSWDEIQRNYPGEVRVELDNLISLGPDDFTEDVGRLVILHGQPGTGKTTFIRSLMRNWKHWADVSYITDPDQLFGKAYYMTQSLLYHGDKFHMIVAEDSDEFLRPEAKDRMGQALARMLNFTDGLIGQGTRSIVVLTTNVHIDKLHPALIRPGRCRANIKFDDFSRREAAHWLEHEVSGARQNYTLAELFEMRRKAKAGDKSHMIQREITSPKHGQYV